METYQASLIEKKTIADQIIEMRLDKPKNFYFEAGQFIQVMAPAGEKHVFRSYSLSSVPTDEYIELCVKLYDTGIASKLFQISNPGDTLSFKGPAGRFTVQETTKDLYFIATGVGLAPIMGMIRDELSNQKNTRKLHLIFGVRSEKDVFWTDRLKELEERYPNFTYSVTLSQPSEEWVGLHGRVTEHIPEDTSGLQVYLCGSMDMIKAVHELLTIRGTDMKDIHFEIF